MNKKWEKLKLLNKFIQICENENFWYIATGETLYSAIKNNDLFIGNNMPEVSMTAASYELLKQKYAELVNDANMDSKYPELNPRFYLENKKRKDNVFYINIKIISPTTIKKAKKFVGLRSLINYEINKLHFETGKISFGKKVIKLLTFPIKLLIEKRNYKGIVNKLHPKTKEGFLEISAPTQTLNDIWLPQITFKTKNIHFNMFEISIPIEYDFILKKRYGKKYMETKK